MDHPAGAAKAPAPTAAAPASTVRVRVWDLPTRAFHWLLAACVIGSVVTGNVGGNAIEWHFRLGELTLALLAFRLLWGVCGGHWSRFGAFFYGPGALWRYLRGASRPDDRFDIGHSPLGSLSVWALLAFLCFQVATGLVADDEIANTGPLNRFVSGATAGWATGYHKHVGQWVLVALVALHVVAVLFYLFVKRRNLVGPMWHGDKALQADPTLPASRDTWGTRLLALGLFALCAAGAAWLVWLGA